MKIWPHMLKAAGVACILVGSIDPLEGSLLIAPGSGLLALGAYLARDDSAAVREWVLLSAMIAFGVFQLWEVSAAGGFGGDNGVAIGWALLILPYPVAWIITLAKLAAHGFAWLRENRHLHLPPPA